jgi:hypothetical protein
MFSLEDQGFRWHQLSHWEGLAWPPLRHLRDAIRYTAQRQGWDRGQVMYALAHLFEYFATARPLPGQPAEDVDDLVTELGPIHVEDYQ